MDVWVDDNLNRNISQVERIAKDGNSKQFGKFDIIFADGSFFSVYACDDGISGSDPGDVFFHDLFLECLAHE
jgi:hypothetical protein